MVYQVISFNCFIGHVFKKAVLMNALDKLMQNEEQFLLASQEAKTSLLTLCNYFIIFI